MEDKDVLIMTPFVEETLQHKIDVAIKLIRSIPAEEIEVAYSGGKDSDVILELVRMSGVKHKVVYKNTTIDPPGTIAHVKSVGGVILQPKRPFLQIIEKKGLPTRFRRFCCSELKEYYTSDYVVLGIRASESVKRKKRYTEPEECRVWNKKHKTKQYYPILYWSDDDMLRFIKERDIRLHPLYYREDGSIDITRRLGCIGCCLKSNRGMEDFKRYPNMVKAILKALRVYISTHKGRFSNEYELFASFVIYDSKEKFEHVKSTGFDFEKGIKDYFNI